MDICLISDNTKEVEPQKAVKLSIDSLTGFEKPALFHIKDDGTIEKLFVYSGSDSFAGKIIAQTNSFSTYFVAEDQKLLDGKVEIPSDKETSNTASGQLASTAEEIKNAVLTDEDKAAIEAGKDVSVWVEVKDNTATVPETDKTLVSGKVPAGYTVGMYFDINLWKQIEGSAATKVTNVPNGKVKISIIIPTDLRKDGCTYKVIRVHDGKADVLDTTLDKATYQLTFETDGFSTYALVSDAADTGNSGDNGNTGDTGNPGDNGNTGNTGDTGNNGNAGNGSGTTAPTTNETGKTDTAAQPTAPNTGDSNAAAVWLFVFMAALGGVFALGLSLKKKKLFDN